MNELFGTTLFAPSLFNWWATIPLLILSIALGQCLSMCYELSYEGLSFSRRFVNSLTLLTLSSCGLMLAVSNHLVVAIGLIGSLAMLRFRVNARDLWEMVFIFAALVAGLCCGLKLITLALCFTGIFCVTAYALSKGKAGAQFRYDGVLRFWLPYQSLNKQDLSPTPQVALELIFERYTSAYQLISLREASQGEGAEMSYYIALKGRRHSEQQQQSRYALFEALKEEFQVEELSLLAQDHHLEL